MQLKSGPSTSSLPFFMVRKLKDYRWPLVAALVAGFLAHFSAFSDKLINFDDVFYLFGKGASADSGRWGLDLLSFLFPNFSMPWLYGVITLVLFALSGCVMLRILDIRSKPLQILLMCLLVTYPSLTSLYTFMFTSSSYGLAFFLAVLSVYQILFKTSWKRLLAIPMLIFSLSVYQPYLAVSASLLVIYLIGQILSKDIESRKLWMLGLSYVAFLVVSSALYYLSVHVVFALFHVQFNDYANGNLALDVKTLFSRLIDAYYTFVYFFTRGYEGVLNTPWLRILHMLLLCLSGIHLLLRFFQRPCISKGILLLVCIVLFPLSINCIYLIAVPESITTLVVHSFVNIYFLLPVIFGDCPSDLSCQRKGVVFGKLPINAGLRIISLCLLITVISNVYLANEVYLKMFLSYENTYAFYSTLSAEIVNNPNFDEHTKIAIIGHPQESPTLNSVEKEEEFKTVTITGSYGMRITSYSKEQFVKYYIGLNITFADKNQTKELSQTDSFAAMANYPYYGSIQKIEDCLVVKLSDPNTPT